MTFVGLRMSWISRIFVYFFFVLIGTKRPRFWRFVPGRGRGYSCIEGYILYIHALHLPRLIEPMDRYGQGEGQKSKDQVRKVLPALFSDCQHGFSKPSIDKTHCFDLLWGVVILQSVEPWFSFIQGQDDSFKKRTVG